MKNMQTVREILINTRDELALKLREMATEQFSDGQVQDPADQAITSTMELLQSSLQDSELSRYQRIVRAIAKIDDGTYGICTDCGNDISEKRLVSFPDASRCIVCEEIRENKAVFSDQL